jgi:hypothetical protein
MSVKFRINGNKNIEHDKIKAKLGLTNKLNHTTFYLEGGTFLTPQDEFEDFEEIMSMVKSSCKRSMKDKLLNNSNLDTNFLMNFEVCSDRMKKDKNTYLSFQYHFKQKNNINKSVLKVKDENILFFTNLLNDIEKELYSYNIKLSKKRGS